MSKLSKLFNNNRFLMAFSLFLAVVIWFVVSIVYSPQAGRTLSQIPIEIQFPEGSTGYKAYSKTELVANVDVDGKKYVVEQLNTDSVVVSATVENVEKSGVYTLSLKARKKNMGEDYTIVSVSPSTVNVMVDVERQLEFNVAVDCVGATVPEIKTENEALLLEPTFADETNKVITVNGPDSEVRRISYITATANVNKELTQSETYTAGIIAYDGEGAEVFNANTGTSAFQYTTFSYEKADVVANVNLRKIVPLRYNTVNAPASLPSITLREVTGSDTKENNEVKTITIKGAQSVVSQMNEITLDGVVDFSTIDPANPASARVKLTLPVVAGVVYDEYSNLPDLHFIADVDISGLASRSFDVAASSVQVKNLSGKLTGTVQSALKGVTVVGPSYTVNNLSSSDIAVTVDAGSVTTSGASNLPATISVKRSGRCWIFGTYQVVLEVTA